VLAQTHALLVEREHIELRARDPCERRVGDRPSVELGPALPPRRTGFQERERIELTLPGGAQSSGAFERPRQVLELAPVAPHAAQLDAADRRLPVLGFRGRANAMALLLDPGHDLLLVVEHRPALALGLVQPDRFQTARLERSGELLSLGPREVPGEARQ